MGESASHDLSLAFDTKQQTEVSLNEASSLFSDLERAHNEVVARVGAAAGTKMELEIAISSKMELDLPEAGERQTKLAALKTKIESLVQDSNLSNAVLMSLAKEPEARGTFDAMVVQQLDAELTKLLEKVTNDIATGDEDQVKSQEAFTAGELAFEKSRTVQQDAATAHKEALAFKKSADATLSSASKKLREFEKEVKQWTADFASATDSLQAFQTGPLVALEELSAEPVEEVPEVEAEAEASEESADSADAVNVETTAEVNLSQDTLKADVKVQADVNMAPENVACPVASDKIVSIHAVNPAALSPQAGA